jgi:uncharacterized membrane protein
MPSWLLITCTFLSLLLAGAISGFFYAWSVSVMWGLDAIDPRHAIAAMQQFNIVVPNPLFFASFFGMPVLSVLTGVMWRVAGERTVATWLIAAAVVYLLGAFLPTIAVNVPMNEALGAKSVPVAIDEAAIVWRDYSPRWTAWNHVRTISSLLALLLVGAGLSAAGRVRRTRYNS